MGAQRRDRDCGVASGSHKGGKRALIWERRRNRCAGIELQTSGVKFANIALTIVA